jgi:hypothetical protein
VAREAIVGQQTMGRVPGLAASTFPAGTLRHPACVFVMRLRGGLDRRPTGRRWSLP